MLIRTDVNSMYQDLEVGSLLTQEEHEEKRMKSKGSQSNNKNGRTMAFVRDNSRKMYNWCIQCIVFISYKCYVISHDTMNWFALTKSSFITLSVNFELFTCYYRSAYRTYVLY